MSIEATKTASPAQSGSTMRAVVQHEYGPADVLDIDQIDRPQVAEDEVLLQVHAAGLDRGTWHLMTGKPYLLRLAFGLRRPKNPVPGLDVAGTVIAVGPAVTRFAVGDEVCTDSAADPSPSTPWRDRPNWHPSRRTSPSSKPRWSRYRPQPHFKR